jgi:ATP-dependent Clp protease, protease subunit
MNNKERQQAQTIDRMLQDRILFLGTPIDQEVAVTLIAQMLFLVDRDSAEPISIYINSPGGSVTASFGIIDGIDDATTPVYTTCVGKASGTALLILAHGTKGCRFSLPHAQFQMTKLTVGDSNRLSDGITTELQRMEELIVSQLAKDTGQRKEKVRSDLNGELLLDAHRAKEYGLIDEIVKV